LCDLISSEDDKAEDNSFETDLIAGRLQEEVVRASSVLKHNVVEFAITIREMPRVIPTKCRTGLFVWHIVGHVYNAEVVSCFHLKI